MPDHHNRATQRAPGCAARWWRAALRAILDRRGGIAIEFALVAPILLIILLGIIQFGFAFFIKINMTNAAREGARVLAVGEAVVGTTSDDAICPATAGTAQFVTCSRLAETGTLGFTLAACDPDNPNATLCPGATEVTVRVTIPRTAIALVDILGLFASGTMEARVTMRQE